MQPDFTQAEIEQAALERGAPRAGVYKWRERGRIPSYWQLALLDRFPQDVLKGFRDLPRKREIAA